MIDVLSVDGRFGTLLAAIDAAGLTSTLQTGGPFTLFAPSDGAFEAFLSQYNLTAEDLLGNTELLTQVLTNHVLSGRLDAEALGGMGSVTSLAGNPLNLQTGNLGVIVQYDINVVRSNVQATNGIIHIVNEVILPPSFEA
jgi:uncharacterized surface protein with fasciclin (FAS1) repeats